ncbi:MAG TPA: DUF5615 family PIN-like protein [Chloroflexota bacterium]|nr:DUF5615 family PIN-like protein [Chloroflexota bacterium]
MATFYLDEDVALAIDYELRIYRHDVVNVRDLGLKGERDAVHLANAAQQGRALVTRNRATSRICTLPGVTGHRHGGWRRYRSTPAFS